jgi:hypothetical protein
MLLNLRIRVIFQGLLCLMVMNVLLPQALAAKADFEISPIAAITDDYILEEHPKGIPGISTAFNFVVTPGEYEPASFVVHSNRSVKGLTIRTTLLSNSAGETLEGANLDVRIVKRWYQRNFGGYSPPDMKYMTSELLVYDDTLIRAEDGENFVKLEGGEYIEVSESAGLNGRTAPSPKDFPVRDAEKLQPVDLQAGESRQFWVTLHTLADTPAGHYQAVIEVIQDGDVKSTIPVKVEVLPFTLAEPLLEYSFYYRGYLDKKKPEGTVSSESKSEAQMLADFQNMAAHGVKNPMIYQRLDSELLERVLDLRSQAGMNVDKIFYTGVNVVDNNEGYVSPMLSRQVREVISVAADYGVSDVYFYARDEARGEKLTAQAPFWQAVRDAGGKIMAAGWQNSSSFPGNFEITGGDEDLFVCLGAFNQPEVQRWHDKGKLIYSYQNPTGGYELPLTWRRNYGLLLWQARYDGAMPYAWQDSFGHGWNDFDHKQYRDHNFTYPTVDGPIDTLQWEGFREGVDDVRYLTTLLELLDSDEGKKSPHAEAAAAWVGQLRDIPLGQVDLDEIRARTVAHILAVNAWVDESTTPLEITEVNISPIESDGTAQVNWHTSVRATTGFQSNDSRVSVVAPSVSATGASTHAITVGGLKPDKAAVFTVSSAVSEASDPVTASGLINASPKISFTDDSGVMEGADLSVEFVVQSDYRASVGVDIDRSLLGWWRFSDQTDEVVDLSTWGHEGQLKGNAEPADGRFGSGVSLSGDGSFVSFPDIEIKENGTATVEGWFRFRSFAMDEVKSMGLFSGMYQHGDNNSFYFLGTNETFQAGPLLTRNVWHHIAVTWDGDVVTAKMYVDGQLVPIILQGQPDEISPISGLNVGRSSGYFGGLIGSAKNTFDGDIDEIRVWSRVLSAAEVKASYRSGQGRQKFLIKSSPGADTKWTMIGANAADQYAIQKP